jgi:hypothetical protein
MSTSSLRLPSHVAAPKLTFVQGAALMLAIAAVFLLINHQAYSSFFHDDALDNMVWTNLVGIDEFAHGVLAWKFMPNNFRPVGHYYFRVMRQIAGYHFPAWVAALHLFHLIGVWLLWLIIRRLGASAGAAAAGVLFFAVNMTVFWAYWRPMYDFDVLCGLFTLLSLYLYMRGNLVLSLVSFWLAYKSKEMAVAIPAILLLYEWWFGGRRWWRVLPFAAISASFVTQAYLANRKTDNPYTLRLTPAALWTCTKYYSLHFLLFNYSGFVLPLLPLLRRDRRVLFGVWMTLCLMSPMLFLPGRLFETYLYLPVAGTALALAFVLEGRPKWVLVAVAAVWLGANVHALMRKAPHELEVSRIAHTYFDQIFEFAKKNPYVEVVTFRNAPPEMGGHGIQAIFRLALNKPQAKVYWVEWPEAPEAAKADNFAATVWDFNHEKLLYRTRKAGEPYAASLDFTGVPPAWQLGKGWYAPDPTGFSWSQPEAQAIFRLPESPRQFYIEMDIQPEQVPPGGAFSVSATLGGTALPVRRFTTGGKRVVAWPLDGKTLERLRAGLHDGNIQVELAFNPVFPAPDDKNRELGAAVSELGFR